MTRFLKSVMAALTLLLILAGHAQAELVWDIQTVDAPGEYTSLALDANENPHISYIDRVDQVVKYTYSDGSSWNAQVVGEGRTTGTYLDWSTSLALAPNGKVHISYFGRGEDLEYAYWDGSSWAGQTIDSAGVVGAFNSLAVDQTGSPHVSYYDWTNYQLKYAKATWTGSSWSWSIQPVDGGPGEDYVGQFTSLALDGSGEPRISYYDSTNKDLKYAAWDGASWNIETVDSTGNLGDHTSIALDESGHPHISYYSGTGPADLKYAYWDGSEWAVETVESTGFSGKHTSLALDGSGHPHIAYAGVSPYDLRYAHWDGSSWAIEVVDISAQDISMVLDSYGYPHISYNGVSPEGYGLMYAVGTPEPASCVLALAALGFGGLYARRRRKQARSSSED